MTIVRGALIIYFVVIGLLIASSAVSLVQSKMLTVNQILGGV